jgi:hypothetical protein
MLCHVGLPFVHLVARWRGLLAILEERISVPTYFGNSLANPNPTRHRAT